MIIPFPTEWKVIKAMFQTTNQIYKHHIPIVVGLYPLKTTINHLCSKPPTSGIIPLYIHREPASPRHRQGELRDFGPEPHQRLHLGRGNCRKVSVAKPGTNDPVSSNVATWKILGFIGQPCLMTPEGSTIN